MQCNVTTDEPVDIAYARPRPWSSSRPCDSRGEKLSSCISRWPAGWGWGAKNCGHGNVVESSGGGFFARRRDCYLSRWNIKTMEYRRWKVRVAFIELKPSILCVHNCRRAHLWIIASVQTPFDSLEIRRNNYVRRWGVWTSYWFMVRRFYLYLYRPSKLWHMY